MCGIAGFIKKGLESRYDVEQLKNVNKLLHHRGPDGQGHFSNGTVGFAHNRLAIQDLGPKSHQPLIDEKTGSILIFNGEIYNYIELRDLLTKQHKIHFKSPGDAEVLLQGLCFYGEEFVQKLNGDFAFAFYDGSNNTTLLCRDRLGVKPLYYTETREALLFSSEIKGFAAFDIPLNRRESALNSLFALRYCRENETALKDIFRLPPAHLLLIDHDKVELKKYWTPWSGDAFSGSEKEFDLKLQALLQDSVALRLRSQRKTGLFLSGGMDSSLVAKMAQDSDKNTPLKAFTLQFSDNHTDATGANYLASELSLDLNLVKPNAQDFGSLLKITEEPIGDTVLAPLWSLCQAADKDEVKVILTGEGADEMFAGYAHHYLIPFVIHNRGWRADMISKSMDVFQRWMLPFSHFLYPSVRGSTAIRRASQVFSCSHDFVEMYHLVSEIFDDQDRQSLLPQIYSNLRPDTDKLLSATDSLSPLKKLFFLELQGWLPHYNLLKLDKLTGALGMEARTPFLDHRIVELVFQAPDRFLWNTFLRKPAIYRLAKKNPPVLAKRKHPFFNEQVSEQNLLHILNTRLKKGHLPTAINPSGLSDWFSNYCSNDFLKRKQLELLTLAMHWSDIDEPES